MSFEISYKIGTAEPVTVSFDIANAKATDALKRYAVYVGINIDGKTIRQVAELVARAHGKAIWEGSRQVLVGEQRTVKEQEIMAVVEADAPEWRVVGDTITNPLPPSG